MKLGIIGVGGIGSTFAVQLARAGHDVTVVARRNRLAQLERDGGIQTRAGVVRVQIAAKLPLESEFDLVLVPVLAHQVDALLPRLEASRARKVMFMFNTFEPLARLRDKVGPDRFAFGFPAILAHVDADGTLHTSIQDKGLRTTVTDDTWARVFTEAGIPATTTPDMESWLRSHAAAVVPVMLLAAESHREGRGISWAKARALSAAMGESFGLVRELGHDVIPAAHAVFRYLPAPTVAGILWAMSRAPAIRASGAAGDAEPRALIEAMFTASKRDLPALARVRPR